MSDQDLESLRFFGVATALVPAHHGPQLNTPKALMEHFDDLVRNQLPRLERAGIRGYAALGVHPRAVPRRGLNEVLSSLPGFFQGGKVVALGEVGLHLGGASEEEAFLEQLALAKRLKLPVLVHTPSKGKNRITRQILMLLRSSGLPASQALVDHASPQTVRLILECGHYAGLTLHPDELSVERAVELVRKTGSERLVLSSDSGDGAGDLLGVPRATSRMTQGGLSERVLAKVTWTNASDFYRLELTRPKL
jgi:predicted metal-dependent TIM-barrel fold hydrolase